MIRILIHICIFIISTLNVSLLLAQKPVFTSIHKQTWIDENIDSLQNALLSYKSVPNEFKSPILAALMHYPELEKVRIHFKKRAITTTMAAFPTVGSIFRKKENRRYTIYINHKVNKRKAPLLDDVSFDAKVGVLGHELAHIVDYESKSILSILGNGIAYPISRNFRRNLEYKVDTTTIMSGLGEGLYAFRLFIETEAELTERYKRFKDNIYMSSAEIMQMIDYLSNRSKELDTLLIEY
jgi:hypothetical protein